MEGSSGRRMAGAFVVLVLGLDPAAAYLHYRLTRPLIEQKTFQPGGTPADAALVFCEGIGPHHGLSKTTQLRLEFAARLHTRGQVKHVAGIGGNWGKTQGGAGMRAILRTAGVPTHQAHGEPISYDTLTNVDAARQMIRTKQWRHVVVISSPIHLHRIMYLLEPHAPTDAGHVRIRVLSFSPHAGFARVADHWREIHHEWIAWVMLAALPRSWFRAIMRMRRK